jgi:hypothetical protein
MFEPTVQEINMKIEEGSKGFPRSTLSFVAGGLFLLAAAIELVAVSTNRGAMFSICAMFVGVGLLWVAIGITARKKELKDKAVAPGD